MTTTSAPASTAARAPAARSRAPRPGSRAASISGSSPTSAAVWTCGIDPHRALQRAAIAARQAVGLHAPPAQPPQRSRATTGVLPAPPTVRLPTQITGTPGSTGVRLSRSAARSPRPRSRTRASAGRGRRRRCDPVADVPPAGRGQLHARQQRLAAASQPPSQGAAPWRGDRRGAALAHAPRRSAGSSSRPRDRGAARSSARRRPCDRAAVVEHVGVDVGEVEGVGPVTIGRPSRAGSSGLCAADARRRSGRP